MPEGDSVWRAARTLRRVLDHQTLTRSDFRVPQLATASLAGQTVTAVEPRGKHLLMRTDAGWTLHTHFMMDGQWVVYRRGDRWTAGPGHEIRVVLETSQYSVVGYRMPVVELLRTEDEAQVVGHLGPDILAPDFDEARAVHNILMQPRRSIADALLDQRNLAGIGNIYKNESCFRHGLHPETAVEEVEDVAAVVRTARRLMLRSVDSSDRADRYVFERGGQPCRRCRTRIESKIHGDRLRISYWCPKCQPGRPAGEKVETGDA